MVPAGSSGHLFGTDTLGDMGCHLFNIMALAFEIRDPVSVEAESEGKSPVSKS